MEGKGRKRGREGEERKKVGESRKGRREGGGRVDCWKSRQGLRWAKAGSPLSLSLSLPWLETQVQRFGVKAHFISFLEMGGS